MRPRAVLTAPPAGRWESSGSFRDVRGRTPGLPRPGQSLEGFPTTRPAGRPAISVTDGVDHERPAPRSAAARRDPCGSSSRSRRPRPGRSGRSRARRRLPRLGSWFVCPRRMVTSTPSTVDRLDVEPGARRSRPSSQPRVRASAARSAAPNGRGCRRSAGSPPGSISSPDRGPCSPSERPRPRRSPGRSGSPPADVDELAATVACPSRNAGVVATEVAAATPAGGVETEASSWPGTAAAEPDVGNWTHSRSGASCSGSPSRPTSPARTRTRRRQ